MGAKSFAEIRIYVSQLVTELSLDKRWCNAWPREGQQSNEALGVN